jgi:hypothetical protein
VSELKPEPKIDVDKLDDEQYEALWKLQSQASRKLAVVCDSVKNDGGKLAAV